MTYEKFLEHINDKDYIMIKLTDEYPYFAEKVFVKAGEVKKDNNYHIANGMFSEYINYEMPDNGISAEISGSIKFEICGNYDCPVYVMNTSDNALEVRVTFVSTCPWPVNPGEVVAIYPDYLARAEDEMFSEDLLAREHREMFLTQDELNALLGGKGNSLHNFTVFDQLQVTVSDKHWAYLCQYRFFTNDPEQDVLEAEFVTGTGITPNRKEKWGKASRLFAEYVDELMEISGLQPIL